MIQAIAKGFPQTEIREVSYLYQKEIDDHERIIVGVNDFLQMKMPLLIPLKLGMSLRLNKLIS